MASRDAPAATAREHIVRLSCFPEQCPWWVVLQVERTASLREIKSASNNIKRFVHPDKLERLNCQDLHDKAHIAIWRVIRAFHSASEAAEIITIASVSDEDEIIDVDANGLHPPGNPVQGEGSDGSDEPQHDTSVPITTTEV